MVVWLLKRDLALLAALVLGEVNLIHTLVIKSVGKTLCFAQVAVKKWH